MTHSFQPDEEHTAEAVELSASQAPHTPLSSAITLLSENIRSEMERPGDHEMYRLLSSQLDSIAESVGNNQVGDQSLLECIHYMPTFARFRALSEITPHEHPSRKSAAWGAAGELVFITSLFEVAPLAVDNIVSVFKGEPCDLAIIVGGLRLLFPAHAPVSFIEENGLSILEKKIFVLGYDGFASMIVSWLPKEDSRFVLENFSRDLSSIAISLDENAPEGSQAEFALYSWGKMILENIEDLPLRDDNYPPLHVMRENNRRAAIDSLYHIIAAYADTSLIHVITLTMGRNGHQGLDPSYPMTNKITLVTQHGMGLILEYTKRDGFTGSLVFLNNVDLKEEEGIHVVDPSKAPGIKMTLDELLECVELNDAYDSKSLVGAIVEKLYIQHAKKRGIRSDRTKFVYEVTFRQQVGRWAAETGSRLGLKF